MKSRGKRSGFLLAAWFSAFVVTPYRAARSVSRITFSPLTSRIVRSMRSAGTMLRLPCTVYPPRLAQTTFLTGLLLRERALLHPNLPWENTTAFFEAIEEYGVYR
jgi:hypothetical protein